MLGELLLRSRFSLFAASCPSKQADDKKGKTPVGAISVCNSSAPSACLLRAAPAPSCLLPGAAQRCGTPCPAEAQWLGCTQGTSAAAVPPGSGAAGARPACSAPVSPAWQGQRGKDRSKWDTLEDKVGSMCDASLLNCMSQSWKRKDAENRLLGAGSMMPSKTGCTI
jgi:hypothetical protein